MAIRLNPKCADAFRTLGASLLSSPGQQPERAVECFQEAIRLNKALTAKVNPELARAYITWGVSLDKAGKRLQAEKAFDEAAALGVKYDRRHGERYAKIAPASNDPRDYTTFKPIESDPELSKLDAEASASLDQGQFDAALDKFTTILRIDAECAEAWYGRGSAFLEKGFPDSAIPDFDRAIRFSPDFAQAYCQRGRAYTKLGQYNRAIQDTTKAICLKPDLSSAYFQRACAYLADKNLDRALSDLDEAVRIDSALMAQARSSYAEIYRGQGLDHLAAQRWDKAIAALEKANTFEKNEAAQTSPQRAQAYRERGFDRANRGEFQDAVRDLNTAVDLDKDNAQNYRLCGLTCCKMAMACHDRGLTDSEKQQWQAAVSHLNRAIWLDPELAHALQRPLADARRNLAAVSAPPNVTQHPGL